MATSKSDQSKTRPVDGQRDDAAAGRKIPTPEPPPGGSSIDPGLNLQEQLKKLEEKLKNQEKQLEEIGRENKNCKADFTNLKAVVDEIEKLLAQYDAKQAGLIKEKDNLKNYARKKTDAIKLYLKDQIDQVLKVIKDVDDKVAELENKAVQAKEELDKKQTAFNKAEETQKVETDNFNELKSRLKNLEDALKTMTRLRDTIEKEEENSRYAVMYYYMEQLNQLMKKTEPKILKVESLRMSLTRAWHNMHDATEDLREKEIDLETAKMAYKTAIDELMKMKADQEKTILEQLSSIKI